MVFIVTRYEYDTGLVSVLHVEEEYKDSEHLCLDCIMADINDYKVDNDQVVIHSKHNITVYRRSYLSGKYELYHYVIHHYKEDKTEED